jgi:hypothetical protein
MVRKWERSETRYVDVKYKNTRQGTNTKGLKINRTVNSRLGKLLKQFINIEIIYVGDDGQIEQAYSKGRKQWHREFKIGKNEKGQYNGKITER